MPAMIVKGSLFFLLVSFIGWVMECGSALLYTRHWVDRGLLRGPILPAYGVGFTLLLCASHYLSESYAKQPIALFMLAATLLTVLQYLFSWGMGRFAGLRLWDYSERKGNLSGRVCFLQAVLWGLLGTGMVVWAYPLFHRGIDAIGARWQEYAAMLFAGCFAADLAVACLQLRNVIVFRHGLERLGSTVAVDVHALQAAYAKHVEAYKMKQEALRLEWRQKVTGSTVLLRAQGAEGQSAHQERMEEANDALRQALALLKEEMVIYAEERDEAVAACYAEIRKGVWQSMGDIAGSKTDRYLSRMIRSYPDFLQIASLDEEIAGIIWQAIRDFLAQKA
ncbi:MAG: putative ABC transporter permease [Clostridiales bacterium]|nr:putative ABC transporter permease [Clostridiales bacterium]